MVGAILDLGYCLNLTDYRSAEVLKLGYSLLETYRSLSDMEMPENRKGRSQTDLLLRNLDCAVIQQIHTYNKKMEYEPYFCPY